MGPVVCLTLAFTNWWHLGHDHQYCWNLHDLCLIRAGCFRRPCLKPNRFWSCNIISCMTKLAKLQWSTMSIDPFDSDPKSVVTVCVWQLRRSRVAVSLYCTDHPIVGYVCRLGSNRWNLQWPFSVYCLHEATWSHSLAWPWSSIIRHYPTASSLLLLPGFVCRPWGSPWPQLLHTDNGPSLLPD